MKQPTDHKEADDLALWNAFEALAEGGAAQVVRADEEFEVTFIGAEGQSREPARVETNVYQELAAADLATCKEVTSPADIATEYRIASKGRRIYNEYFSPLQGEP